MLISPEFPYNPEKLPRLIGLALFSDFRIVKPFSHPSRQEHEQKLCLQSSSDSVLSSKGKQQIAFEVKHMNLPELVISSLLPLHAQPEKRVTSASSDDEAVP